MSAPREKSPLPEAQCRIEPAMLHHADSEPKTLLTELFWPLKEIICAVCALCSFAQKSQLSLTQCLFCRLAPDVIWATE